MNKEDIIRQFGEAKYKAALKSAKANNFHDVDDLLVVNGQIEVMEFFGIEFAEFIWNKKALSKLERLTLFFEIIDEFPLTSFFYQFETIYVQLNYTERQILCNWFEKQLLAGVAYVETLENALGVGIFERGDVAGEVWGFFVRHDTPPKILEFALSVSGAVPYEIKKETYTRLLPDKAWHPYILKSLVASLYWYGGLNKEDAIKVYAQLELPSGFEKEQAFFLEAIKGYQETKPPEKKPAKKQKKRFKDWDI